ncbi:MAG: hypothetical protein PUF10_08545 [Bacteroidales bacterium]|nr:hypothetical protein [Bacteroidales bacterium]
MTESSRFLLRFHELHVGDAGLGRDVGDVGAGGVRAEVGSCISCGYASGDHSFTTFRTAIILPPFTILTK